jgi:peptidoglycan/xylan/chitin deacetylase (PgdA/CDA1 family)
MDDAVPPILCYHKVDPRLELGFTQLGPRVFRRQVEALARLGYRGLGSAELLRRVPGAGAQAPGAVGPHPPAPDPGYLVFTFDDGYAALAEHAFPVLADHGFPALVFAITDYVGRDNSWDVQYGWRSFRHLSWDDLARWQERGIEAHAHGATHARLTWLSDAEAADELGRAREAITRRLGRAPLGISYPFGAVNPRVRALADAAGYRLGFAGPVAASAAGATLDPLMLARLPVYGWDRFGVPLVVRGGAWGAAGRALARLTSRFAIGTALIQRALGRRYISR